MHRTLNTIRPPELSHGIEKKFRIAGPSPKWRALSEGWAAKGELEFTTPLLNRLLERALKLARWL